MNAVAAAAAAAAEAAAATPAPVAGASDGATLKISYPQYSRYEAGEQLPSLELALGLCRALGVDLTEGLLYWNLAQLPKSTDCELLGQKLAAALGREGNSGSQQSVASGRANASASFAQPAAASGAGVTPGGAVQLDELIVFNRSHLRLFGSDPAYRDIFTYINSYSPEPIGARELSEAMRIPLAELLPMLRELHDSGVIVLTGDRCLAAKRLFYFPDDETFFPVRNLNFIHNTSQILRGMTIHDLGERRAYRSLITRELTPAQVDLLVSRLDQLAKDSVHLPETGEPQKIYSLCILLGERFDREAVLRRLDNSTSSN